MSAVSRQSDGRHGGCDRLRVLLVPSAYYPHVGGIEEANRQLALYLAQRGHDVAVLTNRWPDDIARSEVLDGVNVTRLDFPLPARSWRSVAHFSWGAPRAAASLLRHLRQWEPDIVHVGGAGPPCVYLGAIRRALGAPLIFTGHGEVTFDAHGAFERSAMLRLGLRRMLRCADAVTACSAYVLRGLQDIGETRGRSTVILNGVDVREFEVATGGQAGSRYVLAVGRLAPQKGFDVLVEAFALPQLQDLNLVIAGEGFEREHLERRVAELRLNGRVTLTGTVDRQRLAQLLKGAAVFAFPSRQEPFGIALLEAMAAGTPAVATSSGGIAEFARDGQNAILVPPDDAAALAHAIRRLGNDPRLRAHIVDGGRTTAAALSWARAGEAYESLYAALLSERRR